MRNFLTFILSIAMLASCTDGGQADRCNALLGQARDKSSSQQYESAMDAALTALKLAEDTGLDSLKAESMCMIADIDMMTMRDEQAWDHASQAEEISRGKHLHHPLTAALIIKAKLCSYAETSPEFNRNDEALAILDEVLQISKEHGFTADEIEAYLTKSEIYVNLNRWNKIVDEDIYAKAGDNLEKAEGLIQESSNDKLRRKATRYRMRYLRQGGRLEEAVDFCLGIISACDETDCLSLLQMYDHLTSVYATLGKESESLECHNKYVYYMQKYMREKADETLQEMETKYKTAVQMQKIIRHRYLAIVMVLALMLCVTFIWIIVRRNLNMRARNAELERANATKEELLQFISTDLSNPTNTQKNAIIEFAGQCSKLSEEQIRQRCEEIATSAEGLNNEVADYVADVILTRKQLAADLGFTKRELEIIHLSCQGMTAAEMADKLCLSPRTISNHRQNIYSKMGVRSNAEMANKAKELGLV